MTSKVNRRRFLRTDDTGVAAGTHDRHAWTITSTFVSPSVRVVVDDDQLRAVLI